MAADVPISVSILLAVVPLAPVTTRQSFQPLVYVIWFLESFPFSCHSQFGSLYITFCINFRPVKCMGRRKGGFNKATLIRMEEEKLKAEKRRMIFDYHKPAKIPGSAKSPILVEGEGSSALATTEMPCIVSCTPELPAYLPTKGLAPPNAPIVPVVADEHQDVTASQNHELNSSIGGDADINSIWMKELLALGYDKCGISSPNFAVQTLIACIKNREVHEYIVHKESSLLDKNKSPVSYFGFNGWFGIFFKMKKANFKLEVCKSLISNIYTDMESVLFGRTCLEDELGRKFLLGLSHLEGINEIKSSLQVDIEAGSDSTDFMNDGVKNCLFSETDLTDEDLEGLDDDKSKDSDDEADAVPTLTLQNSSRFPILPEQSVECYAAAWSHAIWKSQNFGALAPINTDTWKALTGITDDEIRIGAIKANNLEKYFNKKEVSLPFPISFFHQSCIKNSGIHISQKGNMAYSDDKRDGFYLKKIWRTHCPFITCGCVKPVKRTENDCNCGIIWLDHAVWYLLNNLETAFPDTTPIAKMVCLTKLLHNVLKPGVLAYLSYLEVRRVMNQMTLFYAENPDKDLKRAFGGTKLAAIIEKTLRPISFRQSQPQRSRNSSTEKQDSDLNNFSVNMFSPRKPPRVTIDPKLVADSNKKQGGMTIKHAVDGTTDDGYSVTKGGNKVISLADSVPQKLNYEKESK